MWWNDSAYPHQNKKHNTEKYMHFMKKRHLFLAAATALLAACEPAVKAPEAILPIPEPKQVEGQKMET